MSVTLSTSASFERLPTVLARTGLSRATVYRLVASGQFPAPCKLGARTSAWYTLEIDEWMASKLEVRNAAKASEQSAQRRLMAARLLPQDKHLTRA